MTQSLDWATVRPATAIGKTFGYFDVPAFTYAVNWLGSSEIITQYNIASSRAFVLLSIPVKPIGANFIPCVRYRVGNTVYRYALWTNPDSTLTLDYAPLYTGQKIAPNFCVEIWSISSSATVSSSAGLRLHTSLMQLVTDFTITPADFREASSTEQHDQQMTSAATASVFGLTNDIVILPNRVSPDYVYSLDGLGAHFIFPAGNYVARYVNGAYLNGISLFWMVGAIQLFHGDAPILINNTGAGVVAGANQADAERLCVGLHLEFTLAIADTIAIALTTAPAVGNTNGAPTPTWKIEAAMSAPFTFSANNAFTDNPGFQP